MRVVYKCDHCENTYLVQSTCIEHELICHYRYKAKHCVTCKYYKRGMPNFSVLVDKCTNKESVYYNQEVGSISKVDFRLFTCKDWKENK